MGRGKGGVKNFLEGVKIYLKKTKFGPENSGGGGGYFFIVTFLFFGGGEGRLPPRGELINNSSLLVRICPQIGQERLDFEEKSLPKHF